MAVAETVRSVTSRRTAVHIALLAGCVAAMVWGALAFGAVYPWAYAPLAIACAAIGAIALFVERYGRPKLGGIGVALFAVLAAIGLQTVPLKLDWLMRVSPMTDTFLSQFDFSYQLARAGSGSGDSAATAANLRHSISIAPQKTAVGAALFAGLALFLCGATRLVSVVSAKTISRSVIAFGALLAVVGIAQRGLTATDLHPKIYGFWTPQYEATPFGPFVNPNHFAGWMLMALPLAVAALIDAIVQAIESDASDERRPLAFLTTPQGGMVGLLGFTCVVMALSLVMTKSRSGIAAFGAGTLLAGWTVFRRQASRGARLGIAAAVFALLFVTVGWAGVDTLVSKFTDAQSSKSFVMRQQAWRDTLAIIHDFPATGSGVDTYGTAMMLYQSQNRQLHFQEAHNDYLQIAAEGGLLVGMPILVTLGIFVRDVRQRFREAPKIGTTYTLRVGAVVGLMSIALQSLVEFSLQMPGNTVLFVILSAIALHQSPNLRRLRSRPGGL